LWESLSGGEPSTPEGTRVACRVTTLGSKAGVRAEERRGTCVVVRAKPDDRGIQSNVACRYGPKKGFPHGQSNSRSQARRPRGFVSRETSRAVTAQIMDSRVIGMRQGRPQNRDFAKETPPHPSFRREKKGGGNSLSGPALVGGANNKKKSDAICEICMAGPSSVQGTRPLPHNRRAERGAPT